MANFLCNLLIIISMMSISYQCHGATVFNVMNFGAKPTGLDDSTQAFIDAWSSACSSTGSAIILIPKGRFLLRPISFRGPCKSSQINFNNIGTLWAPSDYQILGKANAWLSFEEVTGVSFIGGALDAKGKGLWTCKASGRNCPNGATTMMFTNSNNIVVKGLLSLNSQFFHIVFNGCQDVHVEGVKILAPRDSPNTDGIHVQFSRHITILNSSIKTGDDCISMGPGTRDLWAERVACGPGHGISIGSLARDFEEEGVENITVKTTVFDGTQNGLRIKSWARPSNGFVRSVRFSDSLMRNVQNPIIIDQNYCPHNLNCPNQVSGVKINDVIYQNIRGTSATKIAIKLDCSSKYPCTGIQMDNIKLTNSDQSTSSCANVDGSASGLIHPDGCF